MNWRDYIETNPQILGGRPVVRGTRLSVEFLLGLMTKGWTEAQVLESYPHLEYDALRAVHAFSVDELHHSKPAAFSA